MIVRINTQENLLIVTSSLWPNSVKFAFGER